MCIYNIYIYTYQFHCTTPSHSRYYPKIITTSTMAVLPKRALPVVIFCIDTQFQYPG